MSALAPGLRRRSRRSRRDEHRVVWQAASVVLCYPDQVTLRRVDLVQRALEASAPAAAPAFEALLTALRERPARELQTEYVNLFDLSRKYTLYLSYWTDGDTRRRGQALAEVKQRYRRTDFLVDLHGELPDFLPLVLEYAALADPEDGAALLQEYRSSLELLRLALLDRSPAHGRVVQAVCDTLPGESPTDRREVLAMARTGPPAESVGLDPYDPRLLPVLGSTGPV